MGFKDLAVLGKDRPLIRCKQLENSPIGEFSFNHG